MNTPRGPLRRPSLAQRLLAGLLAAWLALTAPLAAPPAQAGLFGSFSVKDEMELGKKLNTYIRSRFPLVEDPEIVEYVKGVVDRLAATLPNIPYPVTTTVVRNDAINAFAAPGGYVYVFTGLIHQFEHESELAGVIAHELAHVTQRHVAGRIEAMQIISLASLAGAVAGVFLGQSGDRNTSEVGQALVMGSQAGAMSAMLAYSRSDEREADQVGMNYLTAAGFPPGGMIGSFEKIRKARWASGGSFPAYLSTHPDVDERLSYLDSRVASLPAEVRSRPQDDARFLRIQTLVRARYLDPAVALPFFSSRPNPTALDHMGRGIVLAKLSRLPEAKAAFDQAMAMAPNDALVLREAGRFQFTMGDGDLAARYLQKAVLLNPKDLISLFYYARIMAEKGQADRAAEYFERVLKALPDDSEVHSYLGRLKGEHGDLFAGHLHLAYAAIYGLDRKQAAFHKDKAGRLAQTPEQKKAYEQLEAVFKERAEFW
ncbi:MAG: M48 family metalloprotease [Thermodesulfobacteriota bacterium]